MLKQLAFVLPDGKVSACEQLYWHPQFIIGDLKNNLLRKFGILQRHGTYSI